VLDSYPNQSVHVHGRGTIGRRLQLRLSRAIRLFDMQLRADGKSEHTRGAYLRDLRMFKSWLRGNPQASNISHDVISAYLGIGAFADKSTISLNRTKTALRMFFKFLADAGYIEGNPARLIKNGRTEPKIPGYLKPTEARRFLAAIPVSDGPVARRDGVMFALLLQTGIRLGGLASLTVEDVRFDEGTLRVSGKGGIRRLVYLTSKLRRTLRSYIAKANLTPADPLFPSRAGGPLGRRQVQLRFHHWLAKAGIERHLTVHSLRHTFAMNLYRQTGDIRLVQTALGHRHISTTEIYARVEDEALRRALEKL
jgi:site-specific recombinase XerD